MDRGHEGTTVHRVTNTYTHSLLNLYMSIFTTIVAINIIINNYF